ncbi:MULTISPECIES: NYN domain-containing protein [unclassified Janthinobacterium]|uniref:NYN domain-containing protein n=1 Tax=unclassified Janthinobacterium TaxID=2610881 RepID=UPI001E4FC4F1|nr:MULTISPECIES: NYN domain-containing protein [unclassified Janthinobacterium]MCC7644064.1 NYN domain-containing protein [Janthinobacterium sp. EB271-G4-3-1]MCC7692157.1 NYN domain-containing protein [Janthinobacterium sp. EB271-G4-3-2]
MASSPENLSMAVFCDFENVALGVRDANYEKFDIKPILERLLLKGSIVVKKAYCDWDRYKSFKGTMHEANFELIEIPHVRQSGKNSADIRLVVDALDLCYTKAHVNTFVIISGDSDFSPLVSKLRENAKQVIGVGVKQSTSDLLVANCDEFIFYDDLVRESRRTAAKRDARETPAAKRSPDEEVRRKEKYESRKTEAIEMAVATFDALVSERGDSGKIWASMLKEAIKRRKPDFSESYYGFRTFGNLLEEAQTRGLLEFGRDEKSGAYVYRSSGLVPVAAPVNGEVAGEAIVTGETGVAAEEGNQREGGSRRDSRRNGRGGRKQNEQRRGESAPQAFVPVADAEAVVEQYAPAPQPDVQHEVAEAVAEVVAEDGNAKRGSRRNGRGGRKNGDGAREARAEVVEVAAVEAMPEPVVEAIVEAVAEAKPKAKPRTPARKAAAAKKPAKKAAEAVVETIEPAPVEVAVVAEDKPAKAPRKTPARRPARKKAEEA